ncbi:sensor histidine kinase [Nonomuraea sediminis]|uniref:sensor histidine kinase n=1 Tax=Nonomuraea sediminis TaxID=2835864 RepID=UPI001BDBD4BA|nr:sensor histidine kinase [Nonomuraea sediminis]
MDMTWPQVRDRLRELPAMDVVTAVALAFVGLAQAIPDSPMVLFGVLAATLPQALRHTYPPLAALLPLAGAALLLVNGQNPQEWPLAVYASAALSFYTLLRLVDRRLAWAGGALVTLGALGLGLLWWFYGFDYGFSGAAVMLVAGAVVTGTVTLLADVRRSRTEVTQVRASNLETLRQQAAMAERARIAREMHDIVAHSISMIAVQAESAPYTLENLDEPAKREFAEIAGSARQTLSEMRRLLGVLRADTPRVQETEPQPGLARLPELFREHGGPVDLDVVGEQRPLPQAVDLSAYRIIQEALTNVRVHAPGARVSVELAYRPDVLVMRIADDGPGPVATDRGSASGHGLVGMRERALGLGGWFNAEPGPAGGFLITVGLPLE